MPTASGTGSAGDFSSIPEFSPYDGDYESHWHFVDCYLNRILGYGLATEDLADRIATGALQLAGVCGWFETVLRWPGVTADLLEGKINRLTDAISLWYAPVSL